MFRKLFRSDSDQKSTETERVSEKTAAINKALEKYREDYKEAMDSREKGGALMTAVIEYTAAYAMDNTNKLAECRHMVKMLAMVVKADPFSKENEDIWEIVTEIEQNLDNPTELMRMLPKLSVLVEKTRVIEMPNLSIFF